eukprot:TRINITY_DN66422_c0_g1_i1.p1 TRINITY_DN66422_c0_g1~~TRINITY_DN66422_c0_g1_i1.p1  ORF type:complete len:445 (+),score=129.34 TRINITY_DN66422_c0_g1_i1:123-1337(+)
MSLAAGHGSAAARRVSALAAQCAVPPPASAHARRAQGTRARASSAALDGHEPERLPGRYSVVWEDAVRAPLRRRARLSWPMPVQRVLLVKKWRDEEVRALARQIATWLHARGVSVLVERSALPDLGDLAGVGPLNPDSPADGADLVVAVGGDGTLLHVSRLFDRGDHYGPLPPCLVLGMGSLGFLANFVSGDWEPVLSRVLDRQGAVPATMRTRLRCAVVDPDGRRLALHHVLNECTVACKRQGALGKLCLCVDGDTVTTAEGDGLIVATPTGSTGYNLSCMGPIVSPSVPATLITPIAPHSLSFRPVIASELSQIEVHLPAGARSREVEVSVDGRLAATLPPGGSVRIRTSRWPLPVVNATGLDRDWFQGITTKLKWNTRGAVQADDDSYPPHGEDENDPLGE